MRSSIIIASVFSLAITGWLASPYLFGSSASEPSGVETASLAIDSKERPPFAVRTRLSHAEEVARTIVAHGRTKPARDVDLRAEVEGRVIAVPGERGTMVKKGDLLVELDTREKQQMLNQARAALEQRRIEYQAAKELGAKGFQAETQVAKALADLELANAMVQQEQIRLDLTRITAPFDGVLQERPVEVGDFLKVGDLAASILEIDPLIIVADLPQEAGSAVRPGMAGRAELVSGETVEGIIRFVSREAAEETRTFEVELEVANADHRLPAGISASIEVDLGSMKAHRVSSSLLSLDDQGRLGVKLVDEDDIVRFHEAEIVRSAADAVWLSGIPDEIHLITVGQGFVRDGQKVDPHPETDANTPGAARETVAQRTAN